MSTPTSSLARTLTRRISTFPSRSRQRQHRRRFSLSRRSDVVKPFMLADIGEGITECQLIQWFVQPGARVEHFDKICEVQSDKASVEITSPFDGVIKKLHYEPDDMAVTGKPLVDIDIQGEIGEEEAALLGGEAEESGAGKRKAIAEGKSAKDVVREEGGGDLAPEAEESAPRPGADASKRDRPRIDYDHLATLATPAVRHLTKELKVDIADVTGSGKDGRVLKDDVHKYASNRSQQTQSQDTLVRSEASRADRREALTPVQTQMFKLMTKSLSIPHFLYTCSTDMSAVTATRKKLNAKRKDDKTTHFPFIIKATSLALQQHPLLNAALDVSDPKKPSLTYRGSHNFGVAVDTPSGLLVPVLKNVQDLSISEIAQKLRDLSERARNNKLPPDDFKGASFTLSNIGSVGGGVVSPVISEPQVAIMAVGRSKVVPAFDEDGELVRREELVMSWSADHRIVDGAECARCAERVRGYLEDPGAMLFEMR